MALYLQHRYIEEYCESKCWSAPANARPIAGGRQQLWRLHRFLCRAKVFRDYSYSVHLRKTCK